MDMNAYRKLADEIHKARKKAEDAKAKAEVYRDTLLKGIEEYEKTYNVVLLKDKSVSDAELLRAVGSSLDAERTKVDGLTQKIADRYTEILNTDYTKLPEEAEKVEESPEEAEDAPEVEAADTQVEAGGTSEVEEEAVEPAKVAQESEPEVAPGIVGEQVFTQSEDDVPDMLDIDVVEEEKPAPKSEGKAMSFADMLNESKTTEDPFDAEDAEDASEETNTEEDDVVTDEDELFFKNMGIDF
ncbi:MAG: hypothetical protein U0L04_02785 [Bacteroidaceae bacterium]|nr:hypothetical protein [Bacteroidaceae bacterium]